MSLLRLFVFLCLSFTLSANEAHSRFKNKRLEVLWTLDKWPDNLQGFHVQRRLKGEKAFKQINDSLIYPEVTQLRMRSLQYKNVYDYFKRASLHEVPREVRIGRYKATKYLKVMLKSSWNNANKAHLYGCGYPDAKVELNKEYEYRIVGVFEGTGEFIMETSCKAVEVKKQLPEGHEESERPKVPPATEAIAEVEQFDYKTAEVKIHLDWLGKPGTKKDMEFQYVLSPKGQKVFHGYKKAWFGNGQLASELFYQGDYLQGPQRWYGTDGSLICVKFCDKGVFVRRADYEKKFGAVKLSPLEQEKLK